MSGGGVRITPRAAAIEPMSALGSAMAAAVEPSPSSMETALGVALSGGAARVLRPVDVPIGQATVAAVIRLLDHREMQEVACELATWLRQLEQERNVSPIELAAAGGMPIAAERAARTVARAVRDPRDPSRPFGTLDEWVQLGQRTIELVFGVYCDLAEQLDPLREVLLDAATIADLTDAVKKKDLDRLSAFGARTLAIYTLTSGSPHASSSTPT